LAQALSTTLGTVDNLASSVTNLAIYSGQKFPFVTIPEFGILAAKAQQQTGALCTYLLPVVPFHQRVSWEIYSAGYNPNVRKWVNPTLDLQDNYTYFYGTKPQNKTWSTSDFIYSYTEEFIPYMESRGDDRLDVYLPEWHKFPLVTTESTPAANWGK
jgi:hypothetical protein